MINKPDIAEGLAQHPEVLEIVATNPDAAAFVNDHP